MKSEVEMVVRLILRMVVEADSTEEALDIAEKDLEMINEGRCVALGYSNEAVKSVKVHHKEWGNDISSLEL